MAEQTPRRDRFVPPPRTAGGVGLCGGCRGIQRCRLGVTTERLDADDIAYFDLQCPPEHEGGRGVAHGGWTAGVLDELLGHVPLLHGEMSVTGTMTVRFVKPVPVGRPLLGRAWIDRREHQKWHLGGDVTLASSGALLATASGVWIGRDGAAHFDGFEKWLAEQEHGSTRTDEPPGSPS